MSTPTTERPWFDGAYRVIQATTMGQRIRLAPGEVMQHHTGVTFTTCPACGSTVMGLAKVVPPLDTPSTAKPMHCNATCRKCDTWFQIVNGRALPAEAPPPAPNRITEKLRAAGVKPAPKLPPGLG
jgi:hypothetical protein